MITVFIRFFILSLLLSFATHASANEAPAGQPVYQQTSQVTPIDQPSLNGLPSENTAQFKLSSLQLKIIGLLLFINACLSIYFHKVDKLIIYQDYTDAAFTGLAPLLAILFYFLLLFFEVPKNVAQIIAISFSLIPLHFVIKSTARNNNALSLFFFMSLIAKITIVGLYYAIMALLLFSGSARKKGESQAAYQARQRREAKANRAAMLATTSGFVLLSAWVCKRSEFTPVRAYL